MFTSADCGHYMDVLEHFQTWLWLETLMSYRTNRTQPKSTLMEAILKNRPLYCIIMNLQFVLAPPDSLKYLNESDYHYSCEKILITHHKYVLIVSLIRCYITSAVNAASLMRHEEPLWTNKVKA
jgi:hypothetical protein